MDLESRFGLTELSTLGSGEKIEHMAKASSFTWMAMFTMDSGQMTRLTEQAFTVMLTERCTKVSGEMTFSMAKELKPGLIPADMKGSMSMVVSMGLGRTSGVMAASTMETGEKIK
jgi:hypothetical protein